jgi:hypothetical protein
MESVKNRFDLARDFHPGQNPDAEKSLDFLRQSDIL